MTVATQKQETLQRELERWLATVRLPVQPAAIHIAHGADALDQESWQAVLSLPPSRNGVWNQQEVYDTRRAVVERIDAVAAGMDAVLPGPTLVTVTADVDPGDARYADDIALDEGPEAGELSNEDLRAMVAAEDAETPENAVTEEAARGCAPTDDRAPE